MNFQEDTKKDIVKYVTMEIPLIRAGSRFLCGIKTQEDQFNKTGLSPKLIGQMFELVGGFCKMRPDSYETCLIAALCATSPDRGIRNATDYKILSNIQVSFVTQSRSIIEQPKVHYWWEFMTKDRTLNYSFNYSFLIFELRKRFWKFCESS